MKFRVKILVLAGISIFLSSITSAQVKDSISIEMLVNTSNANNQKDADIAIDSSGNYVIVWESKDTIYLQKYNSDGTQNGQNTLVNDTSTSFLRKNPAIVMNDSGEYVIVWESVEQDGDEEGIYAQYYNPDHTIRKSEFLVNTDTLDKQKNPDVAIANNGVFVVVWESNRGSVEKKDIYAQLFDDTGQPQGNEIHVNTYTKDDQKEPVVGMNPNTDEFVVVWQSRFQDGSAEGIYAQRFISNGIRIGAEFLVNATTDKGQTLPVICRDTSKFIIAWVSDDQDGDGKGIYAQIYDDVGGVLKPEFLINNETENDQKMPSIGCDDCAGGFNVVWESLGQDGDDKGVFGKIYDSKGDTVSDEFQINTSTAGKQEKPVVTATVRNSFIVAWQSDHAGDKDIYKQSYIYSHDCKVLRVNAGADRTICSISSDSIVIGGSPTAINCIPPCTYLWSPSSGLSSDTVANPLAYPSATTVYVVTVSDSTASITDKVTVTVESVIQASITIVVGTTSICSGDSVELVSGVANSYQWLFNGNDMGLITKSIYVSTAGNYQVVAKNSCGKDTSAVVTIIVNSCSETCSDGIQNQDETGVDCGGVCPSCIENFNIPTVFTPNGDGANDTWLIRGTATYSGILVEVYNRWGSRIFSSPAGYPDHWDGKDVPDGVYYYIITLGNGVQSFTGTVTIVR